MSSVSYGKLLVVRLVCDQGEREKALGFINQRAFSLYRATPPPPPQFLFAAYCDDEIVGTMGLDFSSGQQPFPLETHWRFDGDATPFSFERDRIAQYGRWITTKPGVSAPMVYASTLFARARGKTYCFAEAKPPVAERLAEMGCPPVPIPNASLQLENVPESGRQYYISEPAPMLYMIDLEQVERAMIRALPEINSLIFRMGSPNSS